MIRFGNHRAQFHVTRKLALIYGRHPFLLLNYCSQLLNIIQAVMTKRVPKESHGISIVIGICLMKMLNRF
jgi:hypothetical protein